MLKHIFILIFAISAVASLNTYAETASESSVVVTTDDDSSVFKGIFREMWGKLRALNLRLSSRSYSSGQVTTVAGIRGAETTTTLLEPYWKDDQEQDEKFVAQIDAYTHAQTLADQGKLNEAIASFNKFVSTYPGSPLKPNAEFAIGVAYAVLGDKQASQKTLNRFVRNYPKHPLAADAKQLVSYLR